MQPPEVSRPGQPTQPTEAPGADAASATVVLPDGAIPLAGLPRTLQEVEGLRERREILRDQLSRATNRREELADQLNSVPEEARVGLQQRITMLDERILQLERDQALTERLLSSAPPEVLALSGVSTARVPTVSEPEAMMTAFATFGLGVLLTLFISRLRGRFRRRRAGTVTLPPEDPRLERLTQAVDAIAEEVERIGEGQRFVTQLLAARKEAPALRPDDSGTRGTRGQSR